MVRGSDADKLDTFVFSLVFLCTLCWFFGLVIVSMGDVAPEGDFDTVFIKLAQ